MTRDEILAMAREAWGDGWFPALHTFTDELARFAALVAEKAEAKANDRANTSWKLMCEKMVAAEREACAQVCDAKAHEVRLWCNESNVIACAAAIRARGTKEGV